MLVKSKFVFCEFALIFSCLVSAMKMQDAATTFEQVGNCPKTIDKNKVKTNTSKNYLFLSEQNLFLLQYFIFVLSDASKIRYLEQGPYKRTQTAALRQAQFYLPRQAAVAQQLIQCGAAVHKRFFSLSCTSACVLRQVDEEDKKLMPHSLSPFIWSPLNTNVVVPIAFAF